MKRAFVVLMVAVVLEMGCEPVKCDCECTDCTINAVPTEVTIPVIDGWGYVEIVAIGSESRSWVPHGFSTVIVTDDDGKKVGVRAVASGLTPQSLVVTFPPSVSDVEVAVGPDSQYQTFFKVKVWR